MHRLTPHARSHSPLYLAVCIALAPPIALAHGGGGGATIDAHHAALKERLQSELGDAYDIPVSGLESADIEAGADIYTAQCASCHGETGMGDGPAAASLSPEPSDLTDGDQMKFISAAGFMEVLRSGIPETSMPAYEETLTEEERVDVYAYTLTLRTETPPEDGHACSAGGTSGQTGWLPILLALGLMVTWRRSVKDIGQAA